ncbi:helix-turn-helix transcriptional regulator [Marinomonas balearica]|uniref:Transcriptional regulator with XRE-family HTH domain n=1 Tax=Marinomonas balearica TaxID=491947 RepID=A0A4V3CG78_9GAMM|nr:helix-turn-helix transcriptional regulator [Marinomonas balearica]TDO96712.1 transcriptional regulator with XRE-family HTH domain [Marinomonas balearica]
MAKKNSSQGAHFDFRPIILDFPTMEVDEKKNFASNLRSCRQSLRLTREKMASELGVSIHQYRKYEEGKDWMRMHAAMRLTLIYGIPFTALFTGGCYSDLCPPANTLRKWLDIQIYSSRSQSAEFAMFISLLNQKYSDNPIEYEEIDSWPTDSQIWQELPYYYSIVGQGLKHFRSENKISQQELSELLGVEYRTIGRYENDKQSNFSVIMALRFLAGCGVSPLQLIQNSKLYQRRVLQSERINRLQIWMKTLSDNKQYNVSRIAKILSNI